MKYGYIGLGHLGANLAMNLVKAGYQVTVTDLNKDNAKKLIAAGALWADTPKGVAENADAVITCLPSPKVSMAVLTGKDGILAGLKRGGTWIENSTNGKDEIETMARIASDHGVETLEAPVTGGVHKAAAGDITVLVGGDEATAAVLAEDPAAEQHDLDPQRPAADRASLVVADGVVQRFALHRIDLRVLATCLHEIGRAHV